MKVFNAKTIVILLIVIVLSGCFKDETFEEVRLLGREGCHQKYDICSCNPDNVGEISLSWKKELGSVILTPIVDGNRVYVAGGSSLNCIDAVTGEIIWSRYIYTGEYIENYFYNVTEIVTDTNNLYIGHRNWFWILDKYTGKTVFQFEADDKLSGTPFLYGDYVIFSEQEPYTNLYCLNKNTGTHIKTASLSTTIGSVVVENDILYFQDENEFYAVDFNDFLGNGINSDNILWKYDINESFVSLSIKTQPVLLNNSIIAYGNNDDDIETILLLNKADGSLVWEFEDETSIMGVGDNHIRNKPVVDGNMLYYCSVGKKVFCLDITGGSILWEYETGCIVRTSPIIHNNFVCFGSFDNRFYILDKDTGVLNSAFSTMDLILSSPAIFDETVIFGSDSGFLYSIIVQ